MRSTLFQMFGVPVRSYGLTLVIGFLLGLWRAVRLSRRKGVDPERVYDLSLILLVSGVVGARVTYVLMNPDSESWSRLLAVWNGGLSFHGGVVLAVLAGWIYTRRARLSFWACADLVAPSIAIGYAVTRVGCFLNGCCYGAPTNLPWAVSFYENGFRTPPSHPAQIYAALANLAIFLLLARLEKLNRPRGFIFSAYIGLYGAYRFLIEFIRKGYSARLWMLGLTQAQAVSVLMILGATVALILIMRTGGIDDNRPTH